MKRIKISLSLLACLLFFSIQSQAQNKQKANPASKTNKVEQRESANAVQKIVPAKIPVSRQVSSQSSNKSTVQAAPQISTEERAYREHLKQTDTAAYQTYLSKLTDIRQLKEMLASEDTSIFDRAHIVNKINLIQTELDLNK